ncbi:hypothetical protein [Maribacter sp. 2-571]|uniref:hypothetical protein n=1 Tax=Maribacter sp. 2-571 TaxID=3417569 RepID=UPI003D333651
MKNVFKKARFLLSIFMVLFLAACTGEDGEDGAMGATGAQGERGLDGQDGTDGEDGNANVSTYTFDASIFTGSNFAIPLEQLTEAVLKNNAVLTYIKRGDFYYPIPGVSINVLFEVEFGVGELNVYAYDRASSSLFNVIAGTFSEVKVVLIASSSEQTGKTGGAAVLSRMKSQGIDINDFEQVAEYFGLRD